MTERIDGSQDIEFHDHGECSIGAVRTWAARQAACNQEMRITERRSKVVTRKHVLRWVPDEDCAGAVGDDFGLMRASHDEEARGNGALVCGRGTSSYRQPVLQVSARSRIGPVVGSDSRDDDAVKRPCVQSCMDGSSCTTPLGSAAHELAVPARALSRVESVKPVWPLVTSQLGEASERPGTSLGCCWGAHDAGLTGAQVVRNVCKMPAASPESLSTRRQTLVGGEGSAFVCNLPNHG